VLTATIQDLIGWKPCSGYSEARIHELANGRESFTALDVLDLDIPWLDKLWAVLRPELIDDRTLRLSACAFARFTPLRDGRTTWDLLTDQRLRTAIEVSERFAIGEATQDELDAARAAAWDAARDAAWDAARDAAWDAAWAAAWDAARAAAWDAARDAARAAARAAARDAARDAAWDAAGDAARDAQEAILRRLLLAS
jgi:hypothetical protein